MDTYEAAKDAIADTFGLSNASLEQVRQDDIKSEEEWNLL